MTHEKSQFLSQISISIIGMKNTKLSKNKSYSYPKAIGEALDIILQNKFHNVNFKCVWLYNKAYKLWRM